MAVYEFEGVAPTLDPSAWVAETASVIGNVHLGANSSVWFGSVVRGDNDIIRIGNECNVQDGCILHVDPGVPMLLEDGVSIGHQVMLHGCTVGAGTLVGIQSVILNNARIGKNCLVGAGSVVTEGKEFPDGSMILGAPAKVVRMLTPEQIAGLTRFSSSYVKHAKRYRAGLRRLA